MTTLTKAEKNAIRTIIETSQWDMVEKIRDLAIEKWRSEVIGGQDAYTELKNIHKQQGRIEGLEQFFEILEKEALA